MAWFLVASAAAAASDAVISDDEEDNCDECARLMANRILSSFAIGTRYSKSSS